MGRRSKGQENLTDHEAMLEDLEEDVEVEEAARLMEEEARDVMSSDAKYLDMRRTRATDMKNNRQVMMPGPAKAAMEAMFNTRMGVWQGVHDRYKSKHCNESGEQTKSNLTPNQVLALKSLQRKVSRLELVVLEADKGGKFVVIDEAMYVTMAQDHLAKDTVPVPGPGGLG